MKFTIRKGFLSKQKKDGKKKKKEWAFLSTDGDNGFAKIRLTKSKIHSNYGLTILGGSDSDVTPHISDIKAKGLADFCGYFCVGDQIIEISDKPTTGLTHAEIIKIVQQSGKSIHLKICFRRTESRVKTWKKSFITLQFTSKDCPFQLCGGMSRDGELNRPFLVREIYDILASTPLLVDDEILTIDDELLSGLLLVDVQRILEQRRSCKMLVRYPVQLQGVERTSSESFIIRFNKLAKLSLGVEITDGETTGTGFVISSITPLSLADRNGHLSIGDIILAINGNWLYDVPLAQAKKMLTELPIFLEVRSTKSLQTKLSMETLDNESTISKSHQMARTSSLHMDRALSIDEHSHHAFSMTHSHSLKMPRKQRREKKSLRTATSFSSMKYSISNAGMSGLSTSKRYASFGKLSSNTGTVDLTFDERDLGLYVHDNDVSCSCLMVYELDANKPVWRTGLVQPRDRVLSVNGVSTDFMLPQDFHNLIETTELPLELKFEFDIADFMQPDCGTFNVKVSKQNNGAIGLVLAYGDPKTSNNYLRVKSVVKASAVYRLGLVSIGDEILLVNGRSVRGKSPQEVDNIISKVDDPVVIKLRKDSEENDACTFTVQVGREGDDLGIVLDGSPYPFQPITVKYLKESGMAYRCGALLEGDTILSINDTLLRGMNLMEAQQLLAQFSCVVLLVKRNKGKRKQRSSDSSHTSSIKPSREQNLSSLTSKGDHRSAEALNDSVFTESKHQEHKLVEDFSVERDDGVEARDETLDAFPNRDAQVEHSLHVCLTDCKSFFEDDDPKLPIMEDCIKESSTDNLHEIPSEDAIDPQESERSIENIFEFLNDFGSEKSSVCSEKPSEKQKNNSELQESHLKSNYGENCQSGQPDLLSNRDSMAKIDRFDMNSHFELKNNLSNTSPRLGGKQSKTNKISKFLFKSGSQKAKAFNVTTATSKPMDLPVSESTVKDKSLENLLIPDRGVTTSKSADSIIGEAISQTSTPPASPLFRLNRYRSPPPVQGVRNKISTSSASSTSSLTSTHSKTSNVDSPKVIHKNATQPIQEIDTQRNTQSLNRPERKSSNPAQRQNSFNTDLKSIEALSYQNTLRPKKVSDANLDKRDLEEALKLLRTTSLSRLKKSSSKEKLLDENAESSNTKSSESKKTTEASSESSKDDTVGENEKKVVELKSESVQFEIIHATCKTSSTDTGDLLEWKSEQVTPVDPSKNPEEWVNIEVNGKTTVPNGVVKSAIKDPDTASVVQEGNQNSKSQEHSKTIYENEKRTEEEKIHKDNKDELNAMKKRNPPLAAASKSRSFGSSVAALKSRFSEQTSGDTKPSSPPSRPRITSATNSQGVAAYVQKLNETGKPQYSRSFSSPRAKRNTANVNKSSSFSERKSALSAKLSPNVPFKSTSREARKLESAEGEEVTENKNVESKNFADQNEDEVVNESLNTEQSLTADTNESNELNDSIQEDEPCNGLTEATNVTENQKPSDVMDDKNEHEKDFINGQQNNEECYGVEQLLLKQTQQKEQLYQVPLLKRHLESLDQLEPLQQFMMEKLKSFSVSTSSSSESLDISFPSPSTDMLVMTRNDVINEGFGFSVCDALNDTGVYVRSVQTGSLAEKSSLQPCDRILMVNGVNTREATCDEVVPLLRQTELTLELLVHRNTPISFEGDILTRM